MAAIVYKVKKKKKKKGWGVKPIRCTAYQSLNVQALIWF